MSPPGSRPDPPSGPPARLSGSSTRPAALRSAVVAFLTGVLPALAVSVLPATAQAAQGEAPEARDPATGGHSDSLAAALEAHRLVLSLGPAGPEGAGGEFLLEEARAARFLLLGEQHGVAEVPELAGALFRALAPAGYRHLGIEVGPVLGDTLNDVVAAALDAGADPVAALEDFHRTYPPGALFYTLREEARLLADAVDAVRETSGERTARDVVWGLDYDVLGDRYTLRRLRGLAPDERARRAAGRAIAFADSQFAAARSSADLTGVMMFAGPDSVLAAVAEAYGPRPSPEVERILRVLRRTVAINAHWRAGRVYESNLARASFDRENLTSRWRAVREASEARGEDLPRVMLKFGANHMMRGRTFTNVFDLGNLAFELSTAAGSSSFHVLVMGDPESETANFDAETFGFTSGPPRATPWAAPLAESALPAEEGWTVYDLRPLRPLVDRGKAGDVPARLEQAIFAFDAAVVLSGSTPARSLLADPAPGGFPESAAADVRPPRSRPPERPYLVVLGNAQDAGVPQAGTRVHPGWSDTLHRHRAASLGLVDPRTGERWMFEATPDFREQLRILDRIAPPPPGAPPGLEGIFLTHAHIGHYAGLMFLGHESMDADEVPAFAMPRMAEFLRTNGPWDQLVRYGNIELRRLGAGAPVTLGAGLRVVPFRVPHRQEYSEVVGYRIEGPGRSALFLPDIDGWEAWEEEGVRLEEVLAGVDVAFLDGTFFADGEVPGRDTSTFPHPRISRTMERLSGLPDRERAKVRFIHLNHTNPALLPESPERRRLEAAGFRVAEEGERLPL